MKQVKKVISINELKPGMITAGEIRYEGHILIGKNVALTAQIINRLKYEHFISEAEIFVEGGVTQEEIEAARIKDVDEIEVKFNEFTFDVEKIFNKMGDMQAAGIAEVRKFAAKIQEELRSTRTVIKDIVIFGSGTDSIYRHSINVAALSSILGNWIGLTDTEIKLLTYAAILHDFGKTKVDQKILNKRGILDNSELSAVKKHCQIGYDYAKKIPFIDNSILYGVLMHHERMDGSGYPLGLTGDKIHMFAKIIAITDTFEAVNSDRAYKRGMGPFEALETVQKESLGRLDYMYSSIFLSHAVNYFIGENVLLNNGKVCRIVQIDPNDLKRPLLLSDNDFIDLKKKKDLRIDKLIV